MTTFTRAMLESGCHDLPYGVNQAAVQACIQQSASILPPFDPAHPERFGLEYDPEKYLECMKKGWIGISRFPLRSGGGNFQSIRISGDNRCERFIRLKPDEPEVWPTAARPTLPDLPDGRVYGPPPLDPDNKDLHHQSIAYFFRLCKGESKETILRTAENVDGIYFIRPHVAVSAGEHLEPHLLEHLVDIGPSSRVASFRPPTAPAAKRGPDWYTRTLALSSAMRALLIPAIRWPQSTTPYAPGAPPPRWQPEDFTFLPAYEYVEFPRWEVPADSPQPYMRAMRSPKLDIYMDQQSGDRVPKPYWRNDKPVFQPVGQLQARYGVTWRGFEASPGDRALGIYGNEYLIIDLDRNEVMAYARTFVFSGRPSAKYWAKKGGWGDNTAECRPLISMGAFADRVLAPRNTFKVGASRP
ncbi:MAG: hypothetical protein PHI64_17415 [Zoogloea sp.]|uniref:hypothetical protein n=1 Tax=Zoogloea sp. TaxID=49181 RepID=UPI002639E7B4|nr:hypothetical protein [Zoogloea sp.]MDD2990724.1 hypothetical protein [Zoogloea sp.]